MGISIKDTEDDIMGIDLINKFADEMGVIKFQINSFNNFTEKGLQGIIEDINEIAPEVPEIGELVIKLGKVYIGEPSTREADGTVRKILPNEARLRNLTYSAPIYVEMTPIINKVEQEPVAVRIGDLPIMIKSYICHLSKMSETELKEAGEDINDVGGYFIINGTERALVLIEEIAPNRMIIEHQKVGNYTELVRINSQRSGYVQRHVIERKNDGSVLISFANIRRLHIVPLLKLLGYESDKEIIENISDDQTIINDFYGNLYETEIKTKGDAISYIAGHMKIIQKEYQKQRIEQLINRYLLPHLGQETSARKAKGKYLFTAIRKIIQLAKGKINKDDLDHSSNKRIRTSGNLLELLFRSILIGRWGLITRIKYNYQKMAKRGKLPPIQTIVESNVVSNQLNSAMATGAWIGGRTGVSQRLERTNYTKTLSHLRMVLSPLTSTQEHFEARELHATTWGRYCLAETPEGPTIGLRKHLSITAEITRGIDESEKEKFVKWLKLKNKPDEETAEVFIDGTPSGYANPDLVKEIINKRRSDLISNEINAFYDGELNEIKISTDSGRVRRPIIIVENGKSRLNENHLERLKEGELVWGDLIKSGVIEYVDAEEENGLLVALSEDKIVPETTHLEIDPLTVLGLSASILPFAQHNRGDRVNFGAKMVGQAIGIYQSNFFMRSDTKSNILVYPQVPLVDTKNTASLKLDKHPSGQNIVIAFMNHHGYNMQDAIVFNRASVDRGLFRSMFYRIYTGEERRYWGGQEDIISVPEKDVRGYRSEEDYSRLTEDGVLSPETPVKGNDVLIGKTSPMRFLSSTELMGGIANMRDASILLRPSEKGVVDRVFSTETINGTRLVKVAIRDLRVPETGDKFASRHGQKSVIGLIAEENDIPFTASGHIPDLIMNPHSIPSRQTIGQMLELLAGKTGGLSGEKIDGTPFSSMSENEMREKLHKLGFRSDGKEVMYNGITGEKFETEIFVGINYYQKLDHMVANKIQSRARGPVTLLTRQPTEGKAKEGGLRLGEMEKDCLIAHGAVLTLKERFDSDKIIVPICKKCGLIASFDKKKTVNICPNCKDIDIANVDMSYAFKLLLDELKAMLIYPKVNVAG